MPFENKHHGQFSVLMTGNVECCLFKHNGQNLTVATDHDDILRLIATAEFDLIFCDLTVNYSSTSIPDPLRQSRHPWQSAASVPDLSWHFHHPWQSKFIASIRDTLCINNKTPVIAIINPVDEPQIQNLFLMGFDDWLISPITEERLNEVMDLWQIKALVSNYIQIILRKTKNNQDLALTIFEKLFDEFTLQINYIKDALENRQYNLARETVHKLNGSASFCGLMEIQQPANALESCLLNNNYEDIDQHFLMLQRCILNFTRHQKAILAALQMMPHRT
jgi:HPt (histidine-containing phosphotransfer) domain-containing protein